MDMTIDYYNSYAEEYIRSTRTADVTEIRNRFEKYLPDRGLVLDFGCGSGRDTLAFLKDGYQVEAIDGSEELCKYASKLTGLEVRCQYFEEFSDVEKYDGIWACSSILHLKKNDLKKVIENMVIALKPDGVVYMSFKYGTFEGIRNGRYFTDLTEQELQRILYKLPDAESLQILDQWISRDVRPGRDEQKWLNIIMKKQIIETDR